MESYPWAQRVHPWPLGEAGKAEHRVDSAGEPGNSYLVHRQILLGDDDTWWNIGPCLVSQISPTVVSFLI